MPYYISTKTFKRQAKSLVSHWPVADIKTTHIRNILSRLYGYENNHHYLKQLADYDAGQHCAPLKLISENVLLNNYKIWIKTLADLGAMNHIQAKTLIYKLWPAYLIEKVPITDKLYLANLARYLRMAGFDCLHEVKDYGDELLAEISANANHILLTRDIGQLKRSKVHYARRIRNILPAEQFREVVDHYQLRDEFQPMTRCIKCNGMIEKVEKDTVKDIVPEGVYQSIQ